MTHTQSEDNMTSGWKTVKLGEIAQINTESYSTKDNWDFVNYLDTGNITRNQIESIQYINIATDKLPSRAKRKVKLNSIIYSTVRPNQRHYGIIKSQPANFLVSTGFAVIDANVNVVSPDFLYYTLTQNEIVESLHAIAEQSKSSYPAIIPADIQNLQLRVPPLDVQRWIAAVLKPLDDKIEMNARINARLERVAQALFKRHFVRFESYGGTMPPGWRVGTLSEIAEYLNGLAMQKFRPKEGEVGVPVLKIKELRQGACDESSELCSPSIKREYLVHDGDVIFSWSGTLLVDFWCGGECGLNQHLFKVTSSKYDKWFYYTWTKHHLRKFIAMAADMATTMGHIKREALDNSEVLIPTQEDYAEIGSLMSPLFDMIIENRKQSRTLARLRDVLLPRLMSGAVDVRQVRLNAMQEGGSR